MKNRFKDSVQVDVIHGNLEKHDRTKDILRMAIDKPMAIPHVIVATDIISRGVDFKHATIVVHFDFPGFAKDYIHRVGRTCRGSAFGKCIFH